MSALLIGLGFLVVPPGAVARAAPSDTVAAASLSTAASAGATSGSLAGDPSIDSLRVLLDLGVRTDFTNEQYVEYEDAFTDTTFQVRRLVNSPEHRVAGVMRWSLVGTRAGRTTSYQLTNDLQLGDLIQQDVIALAWRSELAPAWRLQLSPRFELRHDRTFGRDLDEVRATWNGRIRREVGYGEIFAELGTRAELLRSSGTGGEFLLDRQIGGASLALERAGLFGDEWRVGADLQARAFPDSVDRDHLEARGDARWRRDFERGGWFEIEGVATRRGTRRVVTSGRDNFWYEEGRLEARVPVGIGWACQAKLEGEAYQYDVQDTSVFFDYRVTRAHVGFRWDGASRWGVTLGPRAEVLESVINPSEDYREIAVALETEHLGAGTWWTVAPAVGWRDYDSPVSSSAFEAVHSSFAFYELEAFGDQPLVGGVRLRGLASLRWEDHVDPTRDASSVYVSLELRRSLR